MLGRDPAYPPGKSLLVHRLQGRRWRCASGSSRPYYRLVYGEADVLPGLVVDRYGDVLVAPDRHGRHGSDEGRGRGGARQGRGPAGRRCGRTIAGMRELEGLERRVERAFGEIPAAVDVPEGGVRFPRAARRRPEDRLVLRPDARIGAVREDMRGAPACSTCSATRRGFACRPQRGRGERDLRRFLGDGARRGVGDARMRTGSTSSSWRATPSRRSRRCRQAAPLRCVVVDPPAFIKRKKDHPKGLAAYRRINQLAMQLTRRWPADVLLLLVSPRRGELVDAVQRAARHRDVSCS